MSSKYSYNYEICSSVSLTLPGEQIWSAHWHAFCAASLAGQMVVSEFSVDVWDFEEVFSWLGSVGCSWAVISSGYSFAIDLFVFTTAGANMSHMHQSIISLDQFFNPNAL